MTHLEHRAPRQSGLDDPPLDERVRVSGQEDTHRVAGDASRDLRSGSWALTGEHLTADSIHAIVTKRAAKAGLVGVTPHALRRTFATKLRELGVAIDTISRYLGHASILTTAGYFDPRDDGAAQRVRDLTYDGTPESVS